VGVGSTHGLLRRRGTRDCIPLRSEGAKPKESERQRVTCKRLQLLDGRNEMKHFQPWSCGLGRRVVMWQGTDVSDEHEQGEDGGSYRRTNT
jgi:hypothetical protein